MQEELASIAAMAEEDGERKALGNLTLAAEDGRAVWRCAWLDQLTADSRYALRTMRNSPVFTIAAVVSLGLGIGANTAIFSLVHSIFLKPLPVADPDSLVVLTSHGKAERIGDFGYADFVALRGDRRAFAGMLAASRVVPVEWAAGDEGVRMGRKIVSSTYFSVLGVGAVAGRTFAEGDDELPLAVVSERWWRSTHGAGPASAVGQSLDLDGRPVTIIGVVGGDFLSETVGESVDVWGTPALMPPDRRTAAGFTWLNLMGRLRPGVTAVQAEASLRARLPEMQNRFIERVEVEPGRMGGAGLRNGFAAPLRALMAIVSVVLLMACTNLAGLQLARSAGRRREIATRLALGASRGRLFRQFLTESLLLAAAGGAAGLVLAYWSQRALVTLVGNAGRPVTLDLRPDGAVLGFLAAVSLLAGVLSGLAPAMQAIRAEGRGVGHRPGIRDWLVGLQVALSMLLLVVGGLFVQTLRNLKHQELGMRVENVLAVQLEGGRGGMSDWPGVFGELSRQVEAIPGVEAMSGAQFGALANQGGIVGFRVEGFAGAQGGEQRAGANWVGPRYFETLGIPLVEGRGLLASDDGNAERVVVVNEEMARAFAPAGESIVGRSVTWRGTAYRVVGVARNAKYSSLREATPRFMYFAALQARTAFRSLEIRTSGDMTAISRDVRRIVGEVEPRLRVMQMTPLAERVEQKLALEILVADVAGFFAVLTLLLVAVGVYGTVAYSAARRTKEIAIRMALGARLQGIASAVLRELLIVVVAGLALGLGLATAAGQMLTRMLFGLRAGDPVTMAAGAMVLFVAILAAGSFPVWRAWRIEPTAALRLE